jgi:hypothetical protein
MLKKGIFANKLLKLFVFLSSLSLLFLLQVTPVYTDSDVKDNEMKMFRNHVDNVKNKYPELDEKLIEIEEKLKTGTPVKDCCKDCHLNSQK